MKKQNPRAVKEEGEGSEGNMGSDEGEVFIEGSAHISPSEILLVSFKFQQALWHCHFSDSLSFTGSFQQHTSTC